VVLHRPPAAPPEPSRRAVLAADANSFACGVGAAGSRSDGRCAGGVTPVSAAPWPMKAALLARPRMPQAVRDHDRRAGAPWRRPEPCGGTFGSGIARAWPQLPGQAFQADGFLSLPNRATHFGLRRFGLSSPSSAARPRSTRRRMASDRDTSCDSAHASTASSCLPGSRMPRGVSASTVTGRPRPLFFCLTIFLNVGGFVIIFA
jgi:hypothetical protein